MAFRNINTWFHATERGEEEAFHREFDAAYARLGLELGQVHPNHIGGESLHAMEGGRFASHSPTDGHLIGHFADSTAKDVDAAVRAARAAQAGWERTSYLERAAFLDRVADAMTRRYFDLCAVMTHENGKPRLEASIDVDEGIDFCRAYAEQMRENQGYTQKMGVPFPGEECTARMRAYGVFGVIAPFNFPIAIAMGMTVGALVTGNTVVFKPAEQTPLCGQLVFECLREAGLPPGVVNLVQGDEKAGKAMVAHPKIDGFVFTGSKGVGLHILVEAQRNRPRPVIAEMGGKNPVIVTQHADLQKAAEGVWRAAFGFSGQKCSACSRVYVQESVQEAFTEALLQRVRATVIGRPEERTTFMGPVIEDGTIERYLAAVALAKKDGRVLAGGERLTSGGMDQGRFLSPCVVDHLPPEHELFQKELFAPFVAIAPYRELPQALAFANAVEYGLTAGIFTEDEGEMYQFFDTIEAGVIYANRRRGGSTGAVVDGQVFVGWKNSGTTGRGAGGRGYLGQFLREQSITRVRE